MVNVDWEKIPPEKILSIIAMGLKALKKAYSSTMGKRKTEIMLSSAFQELLKEKPDIDTIKAKLNSFQPLQTAQRVNLNRAKSMLVKVEAHQNAVRLYAPKAEKMKTVPKTEATKSPGKRDQVKVTDRRIKKSTIGKKK
jgi:hypothetical protein